MAKNIGLATLEQLKVRPDQRSGFAALLAGAAEKKAKEQGKVFNKATGKFELPTTKAKLAVAKTAVAKTAPAKSGTRKSPKQRSAKILAAPLSSTRESKKTSGGTRRASLLRDLDSNKSNRLG